MNGTAVLTDTLLMKCKEYEGFKIRMKTRVKKVAQSGIDNDNTEEHSEGKVSVEIQEDGKSQTPYDEEFDHLIMTPTAKEVLTMDFEPKLPYAKREAMYTVQYFGSVKVFLKFSKPFWAEKNNLPIIYFNKTTINGNGASGVSDDFLKVVSNE